MFFFLFFYFSVLVILGIEIKYENVVYKVKLKKSRINTSLQSSYVKNSDYAPVYNSDDMN